MKIAVISDIHGFSIALDRVLADIGAEPGVDQIVVAGDLCEGGPDPRGVLDRLMNLGAEVVQGNTDRDLANGSRTSKGATYTTDQIGPDGISFLGSLPFDRRITPPDGTSPDDDLLVVHANPFDLDRHIPPDAGDHELQELIGDTRAAVIAFGHIHIAYTRQWRNCQLVDVSAVGNPKDGDLRSRWGLFTWDLAANRWTCELRYVDYPLAETIEQIRASGMPNPDKVIEALERASY